MLHLSAHPNCKQFLGLLPKWLHHSPLHTVIWHERMACASFLQWPGNVNYTALSPSGMHNISAPPIAQHSLGLELCGQHGSRHCFTAGRCHCWVYPGIYSWPCDQNVKHLTVTVCTKCVTTWCKFQKQGSSYVSRVLFGQIHHLVHHPEALM
jgi:hypothetical protein